MGREVRLFSPTTVSKVKKELQILQMDEKSFKSSEEILTSTSQTSTADCITRLKAPELLLYGHCSEIVLSTIHFTLVCVGWMNLWKIHTFYRLQGWTFSTGWRGIGPRKYPQLVWMTFVPEIHTHKLQQPLTPHLQSGRCLLHLGTAPQ